MSFSVANLASDLLNKIVMVADSTVARTVTNLFTFDRGAAAPFAVGASSTKVTYLDADKLDGLDSTAFALQSTQAVLQRLVGVNAIGNSGTSKDIDWSVKLHQRISVNGNVTFTFSGAVDGDRLILECLQSGGTFTITWPGTVVWPGGTTPTFTPTNNKRDIFVFTYNATAAKYYGTYNQNY